MFNKVIYKGTEILNVSNDTVVAEALHAGYTAHNSNGAPITGVAKTYEEGYAAGRAACGGAAAEAVMALLRMSGVLSLPEDADGAGIFISRDFYLSDYTFVPALAIIPEQVTHVPSNSVDAYVGSNEQRENTSIVLSLPIVPPTAGWFGGWSVNGGNFPPKAIYVPDGSVDAYKAADNWSEFAHLIKPMSELTNSISCYIRGYALTTTEGTTWEEFIRLHGDEYGFVYIDGYNQFINCDEENVYFTDTPMVYYATDICVKPTDVIEKGAVYDTY